MTEAPSLRLAEELEQDPETLRRSRRLEILQDQLQRANRRAAGPFSHPYATRGSLSKLREQIRDVSRVADAVLLNAESASDQRISELCGDLRALLQTQQRWTDRLENQIWRLESQSSLMQRLKQLLLNRPPGNEELWALCEMIARDTQALPTGLMLLPEPGHSVLLSHEDVPAKFAWAIEQARMAVFSGITILPDVRGAEIVAQTLHAASLHLLMVTSQDRADSVFARPQWLQRAAIACPTAEVLGLIDVAGKFLTATESFSQTAAHNIVPLPMADFFSGLSAVIEQSPEVSESEIAIVNAMCHAMGLAVSRSETPQIDHASTDDAAIVLTHKLRWHDAVSSDARTAPAFRPARVRRPHFAATGLSASSLTVFARED